MAALWIDLNDRIALGCPKVFRQHVTVNVPHPLHCDKFLACLAYGTAERPCEIFILFNNFLAQLKNDTFSGPPNLHWDNRQKRCDYPEIARCPRRKINENRVGIGMNRI